MKQLAYDIICYVRRNINQHILLIVQYTLFFILIGNIVLYISGIKRNEELFCEKNGYIYVKLVQNSFNSSMVDLWDIPMSNEKMKITLEMLKDDGRFIFSSLSINQEIRMFLEEINEYFRDKSYDDYLAYSYYPGYYDEFPDNKPKIQTYWNGQETMSMSMCKIDEVSVEHYGLTLSKGHMFTDKDYIFNIETGKVSIILGSEYQEFFDIGDTFHLATPIQIMEANVIGFLAPKSKIENDTTFENLGNPPTILDYSIVMPCFTKIIGIKSKEDKKFASLEYTSNLCGTLIFDQYTQQNLIKESIQEINDYYLKTGIFTVIPLNGNNGLAYLQGEEKISIDILKILMFFLLLYSNFTFYISINNFMEKQKYIMAIQILNGKKMKHIILSWCCIIAFDILTSLAFAFFYDQTWILQEISFHIEMGLLVIVVILFNIFLLIKKIKKDDIYEMLWRN